MPITFACQTDLIDPGQTITCSVAGTAVPGPYANIGTVTGDVPGGVNGNAITDSDPSHYFGVDPGIMLEKSGIFNDESGDGFAQPGETISYGFAVTNIGNVPLVNVTVTDPIVSVSGEPLILPVGGFDNTQLHRQLCRNSD